GFSGRPGIWARSAAGTRQRARAASGRRIRTIEAPKGGAGDGCCTLAGFFARLHPNHDFLRLCRTYGEGSLRSRSTPMYSNPRLAFVLVATLFAAPAFGQSFVGTWTATATTPGGEVSEALTVVKTAGGYAVTAKPIGAAEGSPTAGPGTDVVL